MSSSPMLIFFLFLVPPLLLLPCNSTTTTLVDVLSMWKNPNVVVGDSIVFKLKNHYNLYIFQNQRAFNLCNFTQATLLTKPNSTSYTWHTSRPGFFYFTLNNGSQDCDKSQKIAVKVSPKGTSPATPPAAAPRPDSGGAVSSSPAYPWPFQPRQGVASPGMAPMSASSPGTMPLVPGKGGGIPFINSNPAVPLPTGEIDTATIRPIPTSSHAPKVVGMNIFVGEVAVLAVLLLMQLNVRNI